MNISSKSPSWLYPDNNPPWFNPEMPEAEFCTLGRMLERTATQRPDKIFVVFEDGSELTYAEMLAETQRCSLALRELGVKKGDHVLAWLPNGREMLTVWFGANYIGAVFVPINSSYKGSVLAHVINNSGSSLMVAHAKLIDRLQGLKFDNLNTVIAIGNCTERIAGINVLPQATLKTVDSSQVQAEPVEPWDIQSIIYTSGTTGPSKGVLSPYFHLYTTSTLLYGYMGEDDRILVNLPMFHVGGTASITCALVRGASLALVEGFKTSEFWSELKRFGCTTTCGLIGAMGSFLAKAKPTPNDKDNDLNMISMFPINKETISLAERFAFDYTTGFNMTEASVPLIAEINSTVFGGCGKPRTGVECRIVDENDIEVPPGQVGEMIIRSDLPWTMNAGYNNMPEATARAWQNGWFHTGDAFRQDESGNFFFVDRLKDTIRRRGENISSVEVEMDVISHSSVAEAAAIGVSVGGGEEEILVAVVPSEGKTFDPSKLMDYLMPRMTHFMLPRFIRVVDELPKTPTNKVRKNLFREDGITEDTWDREKAGVVVKRERL